MDPKNLRTLRRPVNGWFMVTPGFQKFGERFSGTPANPAEAFETTVRQQCLVLSRRRRRRHKGQRRIRQFVNSAKKAELLDLDLGASTFELSLDLICFVCCDAFLERLRSGLNEVLRFLQ